MIRRFALPLCALALFAFTACGSDPVGPTAAESGGLIAAAAGPKASGHADLDELPAGSGIERESYSFNAKVKKDGSVQGQFQITEHFEDGSVESVHGEVTCLVVEPDGKTARMSGIVTGATNPDYVGLLAIWTVRDNGEGKKSPPDQATDLRYGVLQSSADFHCTTGFDPSAFGTFQDSERGNLQVKP